MKLKRLVKIFISLLMISCNVACDQITKEKVREEISKEESISIIDDNFILTNIENTGAMLSLGDGLQGELKIVFLQVLPLIALLLMFLYIIREQKISKVNFIAFSFIIGGGIGNIYDRILYKSVTDFMYLELGPLHTGIFNMADVSVFLGVLMILFHSIAEEKKKKALENTGIK